ncbi:hypothetical protein VIC01_00243 [Phocaeicola vulgatus]|uniref:Uncharacterized protein n=1 Tax=Phocaeicola vulgatus TaxID=821 RepID=A0A5P3AQ71_PHOVU|nr:hypothetical protein VIC01_00243 [Phocaeicola vulgatus]
MKTKFTMIMAVIATFAISLNLHSSNEEVVFGAPAVQMPRGGPKYCAFEAEWENCKMAATGTVCISEDGKCGTGVEVGAPVKVQEKVGIMVLLPINNQQFMWPVRNPAT